MSNEKKASDGLTPSSISGEEDEFEAAIAEATAMFMTKLPELIQELSDLGSRLAASRDIASARSLSDAAHKLAGGSGTFGFLGISDLAKAVETSCLRIEEAGEASLDDVQIVTALISRIVSAEIGGR